MSAASSIANAAPSRATWWARRPRFLSGVSSCMVSSGSFMHPPNAVEAAAVKGPTVLVVDSSTTLDSGGLGSYPLTDERPGGNHAATHPPTAAGQRQIRQQRRIQRDTDRFNYSGSAADRPPPSRIWTRNAPTRARPPSRPQQDLIAIASLPVLIVAQPSWRRDVAQFLPSRIGPGRDAPASQIGLRA